MNIALVDLNDGVLGCNKDKTGTFGNRLSHGSWFARQCARVKHRFIKNPVVHLGYLAAIFRRDGHEVRYYESKPRDEELVLIASSIVGYREELQFARSIQRPGRRIGFLGAFAGVRPELFLEEADFVVPGEPEAAAIEISRRNVDLKGTVPSPLIQDLDTLPFPDWSGFPVRSFRYFPTLKKSPVLPLLTSRGCSFDCDYCPYMVTQTSLWRARSPENVIREIRYLKERFKARSLIVRDILYTQNRVRATEIAEWMIRENLDVEWSCETRADCLDEVMLRTMRRAGLVAVHLGIETPRHDLVAGSGRIPIADFKQERVIQVCRELGITVVAFYILGLPQDTRQSMHETIEYAKQLNTPVAQFNIMTPYPGTRFYEAVKDRVITDDWSRFTSYDPVFRWEHVSAGDVTAFKDRAYREYYLRTGWFARNWKQLWFAQY